jgi:hypothetical protein
LRSCNTDDESLGAFLVRHWAFSLLLFVELSRGEIRRPSNDRREALLPTYPSSR